jgi:DNA-binding NarL/FixJ family response regulator
VRDAADEVVGLSIAVVYITALDRSCRRPTLPAATLEPTPRLGDLTTRQSDVTRLLATGRSVKEIARQLDIGIGTVKVYLTNAYRVLGARNRTDALIRAGLIVPA